MEHFTDYEPTRRAIAQQDRIDRWVARARRAFWTIIVVVAVLDLASLYACEIPPDDPAPQLVGPAQPSRHDTIRDLSKQAAR